MVMSTNTQISSPLADARHFRWHGDAVFTSRDRWAQIGGVKGCGIGLMAVQALVLMPAATTMALAAALAIGMVVVGALLIGDVLDRMARRRRQQDRLR